MIPTTLEEAIDWLTTHTSAGEKAEFLSKPDAHFHHGVGTSMRNTFGLWDEKSPLYKWFFERGIWHADDSSSIIMKAFRAKLKGEPPIDMVQEAGWYKRFWEESKRWEENGTMTFKVDKDGGVIFPQGDQS